MQGGHQEPKIIQRGFPEPLACASRGRNPHNPKSRVSGEPTEQQLEVNEHGTSNCLTGVQKDNYVLVPSATKRGYEMAHDGDSINFSNPNSKTRRGRVGDKVANTLDTACNQGVLTDFKIRKLTPRECLRLQDFPDTFKQVVSNSQMYKQAGNSMSVNVMEYLFREIKLAFEGGREVEVGGLFSA